MTIEEQLKEEILSKYKSVRAFTSAINIPYSTLDSVFKRGISGAGIGTMLKVFDALDLDIESISGGTLFHKDEHSSSSDKNYLAPDELKLLADYRSLNSVGQEYIRQTMSMALLSYAVDGKNNTAPDLEAVQ
ncbi:MAG: hypothetical protein LUG45_05425 [Clostridiales bacterium]|nr:hypothetical protein [Clostridiales bacterium]